MHPVPGYKVSTAYGARSRYWSCQKDSAGRGIHTGVDIAAPKGTPIVAPIAGTIRHRKYGSAFGKFAFSISPSKGQPFADGEVFFAHTLDRLKDGTKVKAGDRIARVGDLGNVTGPHLHMEFLPRSKGRWACGLHANPKPIIDHKEPSSMKETYFYGGKPTQSQKVGRAYAVLSKSRWDPPKGRPEHALVYLNVTKPVFRSGKTMGALRVRGVRADGDKTSYHDYPVAVDFSSGGSQLVTHTYFESNKGGLPTHYEVKCVGGLESVVLTTRYRKGVSFAR